MNQDALSRKQIARQGCFLHIGSGSKVIDGWVNVDINEHPGVDLVADVTEGLAFSGVRAVYDLVADVTEGLAFSGVRAVYAEHFLEHLPIDKALAFLLEVHRVLGRRGWLRLSTPNLEWVWKTHYTFDSSAEENRKKTLGANRAFQGWGHKFVWSPALLEEALLSCGFRKLRWCRYGKSRKRFFRNLEQHDACVDLPGAPHVIIAEAKKGPPQPERLEALEAFIREHFLNHLDW